MIAGPQFSSSITLFHHRLSIVLIGLIAVVGICGSLPAWEKKTFHVHCYHTETEPQADICLNDAEYKALTKQQGEHAQRTNRIAEKIFHLHCYHIGCAPGDEYCLNDSEYKELVQVETKKEDGKNNQRANISN